MPSNESYKQNFQQIRQGVHRGRYLDEHYRQSIASSAPVIEERLRIASKRVAAAYRKDERVSKRIATAMSVLNKITFAGLKSIPFFGGYFGLLRKVMVDPLSGSWNVLRTSYGDGNGGDGKAWDPMGWLGGEANGVMSPLGPNDPNFNYATGNPSAFNRDKVIRRDQFENDLQGIAADYTANWLNSGSNIATGVISQDKLKIDMAVISGWRADVLTLMSQDCYSEKNWSNYSIHLLISACASFDGHDGYKDLQGDVFTSDDRLMNRSNIHEVDTGLRESTNNSPLYQVIRNYSPGAANSWYHLTVRTNNGVKRLLTPAGIKRVEFAKATIAAYLSEVRNKLAEETGGNTETVALETSEAVQPAIVRKGTKATKVFTFLSSIVRMLFSILPKKIYNAKTTIRSKARARFLCALHVFYYILTAYLDVQFVSDLIPSSENYARFIHAYRDAAQSAISYYYTSTGSETIPDRLEFGSHLQNILSRLIISDPSMGAFVAMCIRGNFVNATDNTVSSPPGLTGFCHRGFTVANLAQNKYVNYMENGEILAVIRRISSPEMREKIKAEERVINSSAFRSEISSDYLSPSAGYLQSKLTRSNIDSFTPGNLNGIEMDSMYRTITRPNLKLPYMSYKASMKAVWSSPGVKQEVKEHFANMHYLINSLMEELGYKNSKADHLGGESSYSSQAATAVATELEDKRRIAQQAAENWQNYAPSAAPQRLAQQSRSSVSTGATSMGQAFVGGRSVELWRMPSGAEFYYDQGSNQFLDYRG